MKTNGHKHYWIKVRSYIIHKKVIQTVWKCAHCNAQKVTHSEGGQ